MKFMKTCNKVVNVMLVDISTRERWLTRWGCIWFGLESVWFLVGIWFGRWSEDNSFSFLTKCVPNLLGIIRQCMLLIISETWTLTIVCGMDLEDVKGLVNIIFRCGKDV